jgi:hypothetical protein
VGAIEMVVVRACRETEVFDSSRSFCCVVATMEQSRCYRRAVRLMASRQLIALTSTFGEGSSCNSFSKERTILMHEGVSALRS